MRSRLPILVFLALASCASWQINHPQDTLHVNVPATWKEAGSGRNRAVSSGWLADFDDPAMSRIVHEAIGANLDLQAAAARLKAAREDTIIAHARRLPSFDLSGRGAHSWLENGDNPSTDVASYGLTLRGAWEPDLWGRLRDLDRATFADYEAALASFRGARLSLAANTAKAWCNLIAANQQLDLAKSTRTSYQKNLRIIERNYRAGVPGVRSLDVNFGRTNVAGAERAVEQAQLERDNATRAIEVIIGRYPAAALRAPNHLPTAHKHIPAGIPANAIERRPDLAAARARILASARRADAARKQLLPNLSLSGATGTGGAELGRLFDASFLASSITASLQQILFDGGATAAQARASLDRNRAAIADYAQLCLEALREVEAALAADQSLASQEEFLIQEVNQATLAETQSSRDYSEGIEGAGILSVLEAQRRATNSRASLIRLRNNRLQTRLDLYLALGGNFESTGNP